MGLAGRVTFVSGLLVCVVIVLYFVRCVAERVDEFAEGARAEGAGSCSGAREFDRVVFAVRN